MRGRGARRGRGRKVDVFASSKPPPTPAKPPPPEGSRIRKGHQWFPFRRATTKYPSPNLENSKAFSICTWNLLAQSLVEHKMHSAACSLDSLSWSVRIQWILEEIDRIAADVYAIQEIDFDECLEDFVTAMSSRGYLCLTKKRTRDKKDGICLCVSQREFELVEDGWVESFESEDSLLNKDNVCVWARVRMKANSATVVIATTHVLFNPRRGDIKLAQLIKFGLELKSVLKGDPLIFAGDFNFMPTSHLYSFLRGERLVVGVQHRNYMSGQETYRERRKRTEVPLLYPHQPFGPSAPNLHLRQTAPIPPRKFEVVMGESPLGPLKSAYFHEPTRPDSSGEPAATTVHGTFRGCVDYVFFSPNSKRLRLINILEMPGEEVVYGPELGGVAGLPHEARRFPSDHLPLRATFLLAPAVVNEKKKLETSLIILVGGTDEERLKFARSVGADAELLTAPQSQSSSGLIIAHNNNLTPKLREQWRIYESDFSKVRCVTFPESGEQPSRKPHAIMEGFRDVLTHKDFVL